MCVLLLASPARCVYCRGPVPQDPEQNARKALRYMPDVVATASPEQLLSSKGHVVFICAVLGEMAHTNEDAKFLANPSDADPTTNSILRMKSNGDKDKVTWDAMDDFTFAMLETVLARGANPGNAQGKKGHGHKVCTIP